MLVSKARVHFHVQWIEVIKCVPVPQIEFLDASRESLIFENLLDEWNERTVVQARVAVLTAQLRFGNSSQVLAHQSDVEKVHLSQARRDGQNQLRTQINERHLGA